MATGADLLQETLDLPVFETLLLGSLDGSRISVRLRQLAGEAGDP